MLTVKSLLGACAALAFVGSLSLRLYALSLSRWSRISAERYEARALETDIHMVADMYRCSAARHRTRQLRCLRPDPYEWFCWCMTAAGIVAWLVQP